MSSPPDSQQLNPQTVAELDGDVRMLNGEQARLRALIQNWMLNEQSARNHMARIQTEICECHNRGVQVPQETSDWYDELVDELKRCADYLAHWRLCVQENDREIVRLRRLRPRMVTSEQGGR